MVREVESAESLDAILKEAGDKLVLVDFYALWCGPCKHIAPFIHDLESKAEFANVIFLKVNVDEAEELAQKYQISGMPTFIYIKSGQKVAEVVGANQNQVAENLKAYK